MSAGFKTTDNKGFHITFENGWTVSVQFGHGNYCDNRDWDRRGPRDRTTGLSEQAPKSCNAEIAAWNEDGKWHDFGCDEVDGYKSPAEVLAFMSMIAALPAKATGGSA